MNKIFYITLLAACGTWLNAATVTGLIPTPLKAAVRDGLFQLTAEKRNWKNCPACQAPIKSENLKAARDWVDFQVCAALNEKRLPMMRVNYRPLSKPD